jgi:hypothetical protein
LLVGACCGTVSMEPVRLREWLVAAPCIAGYMTVTVVMMGARIVAGDVLSLGLFEARFFGCGQWRSGRRCRVRRTRRVHVAASR